MFYAFHSPPTFFQYNTAHLLGSDSALPKLEIALYMSNLQNFPEGRSCKH